MRVEPYLFFQGRCDEALEFYQRAVGAKLVVRSSFGDMPGPGGAPAANADKVMHAVLQIGQSTVLFSDGESNGAPVFNGFSLSLSCDSDDEADARFAALSDGGRVNVPMMPTPFASRFGMVADRFGVLWTVIKQTV